MDVPSTTMGMDPYKGLLNSSTIFSANNTTNIHWSQPKANKFIMIGLTAFVTLGMGCGVDHKIFIQHLKKPIGISVGIACQFCVMPLLGLFFKFAFGVEAKFSIGSLIVSACPGGSLSNIVTYYVDGDLSLSVAMTTASNALAMGLMPMWLYIYKVILHLEDTLTTPFIEIIIGVCVIMAPALIGMIVNAKHPKVATILAKACAGIGILCFIILAVVNFVTRKFNFIFPVKVIIISFLHPSCGMLLALIVSSFACFKLTTPERRAIALECGIQNPLLAMAILNFSFSSQFQILQNNYFTPLMYSTFSVAISLIVIVAVKTHHRLTARGPNKENQPQGGEDESDASIDVASLK